MQVQVVEDGSGTWLRVRGPVDFAEAQALVKAGRALLREGLGGPLRVDLGGVSFMDASALKTLHRLHELAESLGGRLELHSLSAPVREALRATRLDQGFRLHGASSGGPDPGRKPRKAPTNVSGQAKGNQQE